MEYIIVSAILIALFGLIKSIKDYGPVYRSRRRRYRSLGLTSRAEIREHHRLQAEPGKRRLEQAKRAAASRLAAAQNQNGRHKT